MIPCTIKGETFSATLPCNLAAVNRLGDRYGQLYAISLAGHAQQVQAISAGLADGSMSFAWDVRDSGFQKDGTYDRWDVEVSPASGGFEVRKAKLAYDTWHLVAVSKDQRFFLHETDEALWRVLRSERYTTPLLKSWTPEIRATLHKMGLLKSCDFFGPCLPAYLLATDESLDKVVGDGVRHGKLKIAA